jgi:hypothetical protein
LKEGRHGVLYLNAPPLEGTSLHCRVHSESELVDVAMIRGHCSGRSEGG